MPIRIPDTLPATGVLESENIFVMTEYRAIHQDIRPLRVLILNLMPTKIETETLILRKLSNSPLQVDIELLRTDSNSFDNQMEHMRDFYVTLDEIRNKHYDGMIVTGSPVKTQSFEEVSFWPELCEIFDWAKEHVFSTFYISWSAQAGIYHHYGIKNHQLPEKKLGIFPHQVVKHSSPLVRGVNDLVWAPRAQAAFISAADIEAHPELEPIIVGGWEGLTNFKELAGNSGANDDVYIAKSTDSRHFFVFGHPEYEADTLALQYQRDLEAGNEAVIPKNYFPGDDPTAKPCAVWRSDAQLIYTNWLNYYVYQATPYDIDSLTMGFPNKDNGRFLF
ncbi:MAG: homoserine O-succinyltransferase [Coriobacteriia bacterium]|nr:homoserine O-succinyltransferase [Coriobacteriia bacterium]